MNKIILFIVFLSSFIQVSNNFLVDLINPYYLYFLIYFLSLIFFIFVNFKKRKSFFVIENWKYGLGIIITGQVFAPLCYLIGVSLTDIFTQNIIYLLYPALIIIFSTTIYKEKYSKNNKVLALFLVVFQVIFLLSIAYNSLDLYGILYLSLSVLFLILQKMIHMHYVNFHGKLNPYSLSFYGLLLPTIIGFIILIFLNNISLDKLIIGPLSYISFYSNIGMMFYFLLFGLALSFSLSHFLKNKYLNRRKFFNLFLWSLFIPIISIVINNFLFIFDSDLFYADLRVYGFYGILFILIFFLINHKFSYQKLFISLFFIVMITIQYPLIKSSLPIELNLFDVDKIKFLYNEHNRFSILASSGQETCIYKNKYNFDLSEIEKIEVDMGGVKSLTLYNSSKEYLFRLNNFIGTRNSYIATEIYSWKKYVLKPIDYDTLLRMEKFKEVAENETFLVPYILLFDSNNYYIATQFVDGLTFEDYFNQYDNNYVKNIDQKELIEKIVEISKISLKLNEMGWIDRDIHSRNVLITKNGIKLIDYDFVFSEKDDGVMQIIDTYGFKHHLNDIFNLFYSKEFTVQDKFKYKKFVELDFDNDIINKNLEVIQNRIYDNYYIYNDDIDCGANFDVYALSMKKMISDLENIENDIGIKNKPREPFAGSSLLFNESCVHNSFLLDSDGSVAVKIYNLPQDLFIGNLMSIYNYKEEYLNLEINKYLLFSFQETKNRDYKIINFSNKNYSDDEMASLISFVIGQKERNDE